MVLEISPKGKATQENTPRRTRVTLSGFSLDAARIVHEDAANPNEGIQAVWPRDIRAGVRVAEVVLASIG